MTARKVNPKSTGDVERPQPRARLRDEKVSAVKIEQRAKHMRRYNELKKSKVERAKAEEENRLLAAEIERVEAEHELLKAKFAAKYEGIPVESFLINAHKVIEARGWQSKKIRPHSEEAKEIVRAAWRLEDPPTLDLPSGQHGILPAEVFAESAEPVPEKPPCN